MILPKKPDPRFITVRRGGTLQDSDHHLLAVWAADCAEHVVDLFEEMQPNDDRPRRAIELARAWTRGEITVTQARKAAFAANAAAREVAGAAKQAALAAGQAVAVAHVATHELGAAAYAIKAAREAALDEQAEEAGRLECAWQHAQIPNEIRDLVLDDQKLRNEICWFVFDC
ncbi:MAG: hypothetical protein DWQ07_11245 [Chloroflexi bacterium]|nr:MAG: hypothetical protein DWQ07_11245 [Chloroflexota bacterium]MBL1197439.1 hypothetical protein [Chloroflexota bacterium]NOH14734.1 hypothetical protein [Chloroflexota bacterium]